MKLLYSQHPLRLNQLTNNFNSLNEIDFKEGIYKFWGPDSEEFYQKNLRFLPKENNWHEWANIDVAYTVNNQCYRASNWNDIDWNNSIIILGCSQIFGTGLDDSQTVSSNLENLSNIKVINLGVPGSGPMFHWINTTLLIEQKIKPKFIVYVWSYPERVTVLGKDYKTINSGPWNMNHEPLSMGWNFHEDHAFLFLRHAIESTKQQWKSIDCPSLHFTICEKSKEYFNDLIYLDKLGDLARDTKHIGYATSKYWAEIIFNHLKSFKHNQH
jgi:hypothetical protein